MGKNKNKPRSHQRLQVVTLCISTSMVLILLGLVVFTVFAARNLSSYVKEKLTVSMYLDEDVIESEAQQLCKTLSDKPYIYHLEYSSKEKVLEEETKRMGTDPSEFAGRNPYQPQIDFQLEASYANTDSLSKISSELTKLPKVSEISYPKDLIDSVNRTLRKISIGLLVVAALLFVISFSLINNTVKLGIYSRRFNIHTMKLVGASWGFIRKPFIKQAVGLGLLAGIIANAVLAAGVYLLYLRQPDITEVVTWQVLLVTAAAVFLFGILITTFCSWLSVNRFLKMKAGELYKI